MKYVIVKVTGWNTPDHKRENVGEYDKQERAMANMINLGSDIVQDVQKKNRKAYFRTYFKGEIMMLRITDSKNVLATLHVAKREV